MFKPPFLPSMGGKTALLPTLIPIIEYVSKTYSLNGLVDAFCGGNKIIPSTSHINFSAKWINDLDRGVINFLRCIQDVVLREQMFAAIMQLQFEIVDRETFNAYRDMRNNENLDTVTSGALTYLIVSFSYAADRQKYVKATVNKGITRASLDRYTALTPLLKDVQITDGDYKDVLKKLRGRSDYLLFIDPPYVGTNTYATEFTHDNHMELVDLVLTNENLVLLCGTDNALYNRLILEGGYFKYYLKTIRKESSTLPGEVQHEYLWTNVPLPTWLLPK